MTEKHLSERSTREVIEDHLRLRREHDLEEDLRRNVHPDISVLTTTGVWNGHDGVRQQAAALDRWSEADDYEYISVVYDGEMGFMHWTARAPDGSGVYDGADSYLVRDGKIVVQTIHYVVRDEDGERVDANGDAHANPHATSVGSSRSR